MEISPVDVAREPVFFFRECVMSGWIYEKVFQRGWKIYCFLLQVLWNVYKKSMILIKIGNLFLLQLIYISLGFHAIIIKIGETQPIFALNG